MKTKITIVLFFTVALLHAQTWYTINPSTGLNSLRDVSMLSPAHGIAVGNNGVILEYNGTEWALMESPVTGWLRAVHFLNPSAAWAVGDSGTIVHYNGSQWVQQNSNTTAHLRDVFFLDENTGWAVGNTLLKYNGQGWEVEMDETGLNAIHFYDATEGWIVGNYGKTLKHDGSAWAIVTPATDDKLLTDVFMTGPASGWRCGYTVGGGGVFQEYNGTAWQNAGSGLGNNFGISFVNHDHGWGLYNPVAPIITTGSINKMTAGTWSESYTTGELGWQNINYTGVDAVDMDNAVVSAATGIMYHYQNGNWLLGNAFADNHIRSIDFITPSNGRIAAGHKGIRRYENGNWTTELQDEGYYFHFVSFSDSLNGWAVASKDWGESSTYAEYMVYKYYGGEWSEFDYNAWYHPFVTAYAIDENHLWKVISENTLVFFNQQGAAAWIDDLNIDVIYSLYFTDAENGWIAGWRVAAGSKGVIMRLENGEWSTVYENPDKIVSDISFLEDGTAFATGEYGLLLHFDGNVWSELPSPTETYLHTIHMIDHQNGWAAGENGILLYFDGNSWSLSEQNPGKTILCIDFPEPDFGLMGGIHGAMFATTPQLPVGIENPEKTTTDKALHIYPNPAANQVSLSFHLNDPAFTYIEVYDLSGRKVLATTPRQKTPGYNTEILNISHLVKGVYLLKVNMGNGPGLTGKLMIK
jgi:photosystem II stability/assembly factor-like uncharacterized protein